jgi:UDP-glucose 4-epimerase
MTVLVTGGAGFIGSHMVHALVDVGEPVVVLDNLSTGFEAAIPRQIPVVVGDTSDGGLLTNIISQYSVTDIIHFAASIVVPDSMRDPLSYYKNNTANSRTVIEAAVRNRVKNFIFSSTAAVYGNPLRVPVQEDDPILPISPYGSSKAMTEVMLRDASKAYGLNHVILRYFNVTGADPAMRTGQSTPGATHLVKVAVQTALGLRDSIKVFGTDYPTPDGTCVRDFIHVSDLVAAHADALGYLRSGGASATMNCGYGRGFSVLEVIEAVRMVSGAKVTIEKAPRRVGDPVLIVAASDRLRNVLRWQPQFDDLTTMVAHALAWEINLPYEAVRLNSLTVD